MDAKLIKDISDFLGKEDERYFSCGFKFFDYQYENLCYRNKLFSGLVIADYNWNGKKNRHLHLGTVEYIAISSTICEQILLSEFHLAPEQISISWIKGFKTKIQSRVNLANGNKLEISGKLTSTERDEKTIDGYKSSIDIKINNTTIKVELCHPIQIWFNGLNDSTVKINNSSLYHTGYKLRKHSIKDVYVNENQMNCDALISIEDYYSQRSGLGSAYKSTLLTDIILISGQMVQTLFYCLEKIDRKTANNIWLKEFCVSIDNPNNEMNYQAKLSFEDIQILKKGNETWKSILFRNKLGNLNANIKMVSKIN